jgi:DNA-binding phage protein
LTPPLTAPMIGVMPDQRQRRALARIEATKQLADEARVAAETAERKHHEAILRAAAIPGLTVTSIAKAAGVSRTRIYKRFASPVYGQRQDGEPQYGPRPLAPDADAVAS